MTSYQHKAVTFNEGEPLDPVKLNKLASNIDNLYKAQSQGNQTNDSGAPSTPIIFHRLFKFEKVAQGAMDSETFNFEGYYTAAEIASGKIHAVASVRSKLAKGDNISVSVANITGTPTVYVVNNSSSKDPKTIYVDVIATYLKPI